MGLGQEPLRSAGLSSCALGKFLSENTYAENPESDIFIVGEDGKWFAPKIKTLAPAMYKIKEVHHPSPGTPGKKILG